VSKFIDLTGRVFGKLTVASFAGRKPYGNGGQSRSMWNCDCSCGNKTVVSGGNLQFGHTMSCSRCPNRIDYFGNAVVIWLNYQDYEMACFIDAADYPLVKGYRWYAHIKNSGGYYGRSVEGIFVHALLMGAKGVDHIDGDGLNNRRENLRVATVSENRTNTGARINNTTGFKGVFPRNNGTFQASIRKNGTRYHLGVFNTALEAARAWNIAAKKYHGEFAYQNDVGDHDIILNQKPEVQS
jgi:HNH endonuclease